MIVNETLKIIKQPRSIRSFKDEQIKEEELQVVLEAANTCEQVSATLISCSLLDVGDSETSEKVTLHKKYEFLAFVNFIIKLKGLNFA